MEMTAENLANDTRQRASEQWYVGKSLTTGSPGKESVCVCVCVCVCTYIYLVPYIHNKFHINFTNFKNG